MSTALRRPTRLMRSLPFHYSWVVLMAGSIGMIATSPGQTFAISIFIEHFIRDLGISRGLVSTLYTVGTLTASVGLPWVGRIIDNRGTQFTAVVVSVILALACVYMGLVQGPVMLVIGFVFLRWMGQGSLELTSSTLVNHWWVRRRGLALGIAGVLLSVGTGPVPRLINDLIERVGWRQAYPLLGLIVIAIVVPVALFFYRRPPEEYGLEPDGGLVAAQDADKSPGSAIKEENWTPREAVRTPAFWIAGLGFGTMSMLTTGLHFHMVSIGTDAGLTAAEAATIYVPMSLTMSAVSLLAGILVDRVPVRYMLAGALVLQAISLVMAPLLSGVAMAFAYGIVLGATSGLSMTARGVIWASFFGRKHLGAITGTVGLIMVAGSALGPMPFGIARDLLGSYRGVLFVSAVFPVAIALLALTMRRPTKGEGAPHTRTS